MATTSHTDEETGSSLSQVPTTTAIGITWKDKVRNEEIRRKTGLRILELIIKDRRLSWLGHVLRMEDSRIPRQAVQWELMGYKRKPGQPRKNWMDIIR